MSSIIAMLSFADLGMGNGIMNAVAAASGRDDMHAIKGLVSSGVIVLSGVALFVLLFFAFIYPFVDWGAAFGVKTTEATRVAGPAFATLIGCLAIAIPLGIVQRVQMGLQQSFLVSLWQAIGSFTSILCLLIAINSQADLPWLVASFSGAPLFAALANSVIFFQRQYPEIMPSLKAASFSSAKSIASIGFIFLGLQIITGIAFSSDNIVITHVLGANAVADFAVPQRLFNVVGMLMMMVLTPLWPAYGEAIARGDNLWAIRTLKRSLLLAAIFSALSSASLVAVSPWLIPLWVGPSVHPTFALLLGFGIWKVIEAVANAIAIFLNGANLMWVQLIVGALGIGFGIPLKVYMINKIGISGAVYSLIASYVFVCLPLLILYMKSKFRY